MSLAWTGVALAVGAFWALQLVACAPLLASGTVRSQFRRGPSASPLGNYLLTVTLVIAGHVLTFLAGVAVTGGFEGRGVLVYVFAVAGGYPLVLAAGLYGLTYARGHPLRAWTVVLAGVWYAVVGVLAAAIVFLFLFVLFVPV